MRFIRCDNCGAEQPNPGDRYLGPDLAWISVEANEDSDNAQLCSLLCLASLATSRAMDREIANG